MNGSDKLRFGVIGVGRYATGYHLPLIVRSGDAELVAIHRRSPDRLAQTAEAFDVPHAFADYREMLDSVDLDVVVVSGPQGLHHEWCMAALERGHHVRWTSPGCCAPLTPKKRSR